MADPHDPTFDAPGRTYRFGWGTSSRKTNGPAISIQDLGSIDAVLLTAFANAPSTLRERIRWSAASRGGSGGGPGRTGEIDRGRTISVLEISYDLVNVAVIDRRRRWR